jgi:hypothetical protein
VSPGSATASRRLGVPSALVLAAGRSIRYKQNSMQDRGRSVLRSCTGRKRDKHGCTHEQDRCMSRHTCASWFMVIMHGNRKIVARLKQRSKRKNTTVLQTTAQAGKHILRSWNITRSTKCMCMMYPIKAK